jgi:hypothetical protein
LRIARQKFAYAFSAAVFFGCALLAIYLRFGDKAELSPAKIPHKEVATPADVPPIGQTQFAKGFIIDQPLVVEFTMDNRTLAEFTPRERRDQDLDWLLFAAVAAFTPSTEEFNRTTFDLPAVRHGYLKPLANFEYGETRSRFIGEGIVLALVPANTSANARKDYLAHVADEHRKNLGGAFDRLRVIEYEFDIEKATATLTRRADVEAALLFSPEYGYFEQDVATAPDLAAFMARVDDLTAANKTASGLILGGRKILDRRYRQITIEEVATVWQAEHKIKILLEAFEGRARRAVDEFNRSWRGRTYRTAGERAKLEQQRDAEWAQLEGRLTAERRTLKIVRGSGFSLDPARDFNTLAEQFSDLNSSLKDLVIPEEATAIRRRIPDLDGALRKLVSSDRIAAISNGLKQGNIIPLLVVADEMRTMAARNPLAGLFYELFEALERRHRFQVARYDGDLQGTEVGMVLFYTDLLAKIWVIDFQRNAPTGAIPGFIDGPSVPRSRIYERDDSELSAGRLWFGAADLGFQLTQSRDSIFLARNATRVYSAGFNLLNPGVEQETSVSLGTPIIWWNDHYEEVARFEPEYERLNQIMKWSIVVGWLNESRSGDKLTFLADVAVDRSKRLLTWAAQHLHHRFKQWDDIRFLPAGYLGTSTEAMPILVGSTYQSHGRLARLGGGVSLAPMAAFKDRTPIATGLERTALRSNINYGAPRAGERTITTFDNAVYNFKVHKPNVVSLMANARPEAKLRGKSAELANIGIERTIAFNSTTVRIETRVAEAPIGNLEMTRTTNGFRISWQSRELDLAHSLGQRMSLETNPIEALLVDADVSTIIKLPWKNDFLVKLRGADNWIRFAEETPTSDLVQSWQMRAAGYDAAKYIIQIAVLNASRVNHMVGHLHLVVESADAESKVVIHAQSGS